MHYFGLKDIHYKIVRLPLLFSIGKFGNSKKKTADCFYRGPFFSENFCRTLKENRWENVFRKCTFLNSISSLRFLEFRSNAFCQPEIYMRLLLDVHVLF